MPVGRLDFLSDVTLSRYQIEFLSRLLHRARVEAHEYRDLVDMKTIDLITGTLRRALDDRSS